VQNTNIHIYSLAFLEHNPISHPNSLPTLEYSAPWHALSV
jgi:hypothetical protein